VFHASYVPTHGAIAAWAGLGPLVLSAWGSDVTPPSGRDKSWPIRKLIGYALRRADTVCVTSEFLAQQVRRYAPSVQPYITPFGVDTEQFAPADQTTRHSGPFTIGIAKTIAPMYGQQVVLDTLPAIHRAIGEVRLVLIGSDRTRGAIRQRARRLGVENLIEFRGFVPHRDLPSHLRGLDLAVNPSICQESFGVSVLEASACGLPVVATDVGGVREVCRDGHTGQLVPPADATALGEAIIHLAGRESLRDQMGREGRRFVEKYYSWDRCVDTMLEQLRRTAEGQPG
jgi:glycosyltransferase involved in cell wall biosynthesis